MEKITPSNINPPCHSCGVHHTGRCQLFKIASPADDIVWSESSYSLQEMNDMYSVRLPYLARVGLGDFGDTEASTIEIGQVLRVAKHYDQPRVIAVSENGTVLSIPLSLPLKFSPLKSKTNNLTTRFSNTVRAFSKGKTLSEFTKKFPVTVCLCENAYSDDVMVKGAFSHDDIRQITLTRLHKYTYIVCNEVTGGVLNTENTLLMPTFMRMKLRISKDQLKNGSQFTVEQLQQFQDTLTESMQGIGLNEILEPQQIFHYEGSYNNTTQYERLQPTEYVQHMYTRSKQTLFALVSSQGYRVMQKVRKAFTQANNNPESALSDDEGIYETIAMTKENRFKYSKQRKPSLPPKPPTRQIEATADNYYDITETGPVHPQLVKQLPNAVGPSEVVQEELAKRLKTQRSVTSYTSAFDDITVLSVMEVGDILDKLNLRKYKLKFYHRQIDGNMLKDLVSDESFDFKAQFEMDNLEEKKLKKCVQENWLPNM